MSSGWESIERAVIHWVTCTAHDEFLGRVLTAVQSDAVGIPLYVFALALVARRDARRAVRTFATAGIAVALSMAVAGIFWETWPRPRPPLVYERLLRSETELAACGEHPTAFPVRDRVSSRPAFPSRHGVTVGALLAALFFASWRLGVAALPYGLLVVYGRVYMGRHWPSDLLAGVAIGAAFAWLLWPRLPRLHAWIVSRCGRTGHGPEGAPLQ